MFAGLGEELSQGSTADPRLEAIATLVDMFLSSKPNQKPILTTPPNIALSDQAFGELECFSLMPCEVV